MVVRLQRARAAVAEHEGAGCAGLQRVEGALPVEAERVGERERLGGGGDVHAAQQLVDGLERLAVARTVADDREGGGEPLEHGARDGERRVGRADDDEQVALARPHGSAGQRRVDEVRADGLEPRCQLGDARRADGAREEHGGAGPQVRAERLLAEQQRLELLARAHGDEHDVGGLDGVCCARRGAHAVRGGELEPLLGDVEACDVECVREPRRHGQSHGAEPDDGDGAGHAVPASFDGGHRSSPARVRTTAARESVSPTLPANTT